MPERPRIYNYDPAKDGWKAVPSEKATVNYIIDSPKRGKIECSSPLLHYFKGGKSMCAKFPTEPADANFQNTTQAYCSDCLVGARAFSKHSKALEDDCIAGKITRAEAESENVIDYKAAEKKDHPEGAKVSH